MLGGDPYSSGDAPTIVIFSGAVVKRAEKIPPFFSGSGIAAEVGHPFVAVADSSLELSQSIGLAWYSGNSMFDQGDTLRQVLTPLAQQKGKNLWLVGGSAGGFAALNLAHLLPNGPSLLTWNPQTDFLQYVRESVVEYATTAFPVTRRELAGDDYKQVLRSVFSYFGRRHTVLDDLPDQGPGRLVYLQNPTDWHLASHCVPYMKSHGYTQSGPGLWRRDDDKVVWIANFAQGHTPPERSLLVEFLKRFTSTTAGLLPLIEEFDQVSLIGDDPSLRPIDLSSASDIVERLISFDFENGIINVKSERLPDGFGGLRWRVVIDQDGQATTSSFLFRKWSHWKIPLDPRNSPGILLEIQVVDGFDNIVARYDIT
ncbi:hypothetical protein, partial [Gulosibacter sediminis]|uniref:hypothetical protein n=1 Tax=Gulosibacter sediminis TaxID=1729695 RepID=UPI001866DB56